MLGEKIKIFEESKFLFNLMLFIKTHTAMISQPSLDLTLYKRPSKSIFEYQNGFNLRVSVHYKVPPNSYIDYIFRLAECEHDIYISPKNQKFIISSMSKEFSKVSDTLSKERLFLHIALEGSTELKDNIVTLYSEPSFGNDIYSKSSFEGKHHLRKIEGVSSVSILDFLFVN